MTLGDREGYISNGLNEHRIPTSQIVCDAIFDLSFLILYRLLSLSPNV